MVDKNSKLADDFITGLKNSPNVYAQTVSKFFVEPTLGLMVPGSNEEERQDVKNKIANKKASIDFFQNNPGFVAEMERINKLIPQQRGPEIAKLYNRYEALGMPKFTFMEQVNRFREYFFGDSYDIHAGVASGEVGVTDFRSIKEFTDYAFGILDVIDVTGITTLVGRGLSKQGQKLLSGLTEESIQKGEAEKILKNLSKEDQEIISDTVTKHSSMQKTIQRDKQFNDILNNLQPGEKIYAADFLTDAGIEPTRRGKIRGSEDYYNQDLRIVKRFLKRNPDQKDRFVFTDKGDLANVISKSATEGSKRVTEIIDNIYARYQKDISEGKQVFAEGQKGAYGLTFESLAKEAGVTVEQIERILGRRSSVQFKFNENTIAKFDELITIPAKGKRDATTELIKFGIGKKPNDPKLAFLQQDSRTFKLDEVFGPLEEIGFVPIVGLRGEERKVTIAANNALFDNYMAFRESILKGVGEEGNIAKVIQKANNRNDLTQYSTDLFFDAYNSNKAFKDRVDSEMERIGITSLNRFVKSNFGGHLSHIYSVADLGKQGYMKGTAGFADLMRVNYGSRNKFVQPKIEAKFKSALTQLEAIIGDKSGKYIQKDLFNKKTSGINKFLTTDKRVQELLTTIKQADSELSEIGMASFRKIKDGRVAEFLKDSGFDVGLKEGDIDADIFIGSNKEFSLQELKDQAKQTIDGYVNNPETFVIKGQAGVSPGQKRTELAGEVTGLAKGYVEFEQGGDVETEKEDQSFLSKAVETVGGLFVGKAEAAPIGKIFNLVGDAPTAVKQVDTGVKQITSDVIAPTLEKRYNILDENGRKVFQSKSMDDAQQKALRLGDLEGKEFKVEEIEIPVKVKKKKETSTALVPTVTVDNAIGTGNNKLFYSDLDRVINTPSGNITVKGNTVPANSVSMSAKEWHDWFRSNKVREGELYDSYIRTYLNKKGGFNRETNKFTNDEPITFAEIKELSDTSPTNYLQTVSYSDASGNLKYGNTGRQDGTINGSRVERVLWLDSKDIRGDIGSLPREIRSYEGHRDMRQVTDSDDFSVQGNKLEGEPYVVGWSLNSNRVATLNNKPIIVNVADEIQSDFLQKAATLKSGIKKDIRTLVQGQNTLPGRSQELEQLYLKLDNIFRPMPATYAQLKKSLDELIESDAIFQRISEMEIDDLTKQSFIELGKASKVRDKALATINSTIDNIDARELFPNIPLKDQKDWVDAIIKNDIYNAAKNRFSFDESGKLIINNEAPAYYAVAPAKAVKAYRGGQGIELAPDNIDRRGQMVAYDMQYGGPNLNDHTGAHFTSNVEESLNRIAQNKSSKVEIGKVDFGNAGSAVDTFMIELTPDMLLPYKAYFNDGGLVKKSILYTPIVPLKRVLSPIGASRW
jgi:hypothetical protein